MHSPLPVPILGVDDRPENLLALEVILAPLGHTLIKVHSGAEALNYLLNHDVAVILLDVMMPEIDGFETARLIRGRERSKDTPIIFLTAMEPGAPQIAQGYALGAVDYLVKPLVADVVRAKVAALVQLFLKAEALRRQAETLRQREQHLAIAEQVAHVGSWLWEIEANQLRWSDELFRIYGLEPQSREMSYEDFLGMVHPDDRALVELRVGQALETYQAFSFDHRIVRPDGGLRTIHAQGQVLLDERGRPERLIGTGLDITERSEAEAAREQLLREQLALSEAAAAHRRMALLSEAGALLGSSLDYATTLASLTRLIVPRVADWCAVYMLRDDGQIVPLEMTHRDPAMLTVLHALIERYPPGQDHHSPIAASISSGQSQRIASVNLTVFEAAGQEGGQLALLRQLAPISYMIVPMRARERTLGAIAFASVESGRHFSEEDLDLAEEIAHRAALAIDNASLYAKTQQAEEQARQLAFRLKVLADTSRTFVEAGLELSEVLEQIAQSVSTVVGDVCAVRLLSEDGQWLHVAALYHPDPETRAQLREVVGEPQHIQHGVNAQVARSGRPLLLAYLPGEALRQALPEGHWTYLERHGAHSIMVAPLRVRGTIIGTLSVARDRTPETFTVEDQRFLEELADRAAQVIDNARLYAEARSAIQARERFLSIAAHELKTPVTSLLGYSQLLKRRLTREGTLSPRDQLSLDRQVEQVERLHHMTNALLDLSRLHGESFSLDLRPVDLNGLLYQLAEELRLSLQQHTLELEGLDEPVIIQGDELRLRQIFHNLLQNAIKYSPGGGTIGIRLEQRPTSVAIAIQDQGIGIPQEALPSLFTIFYRADNARMQGLQGMGVGLAVVKELVAGHGGEIEVSSSEGQGSTFRVILPMSETTRQRITGHGLH